MEKPFWYQFGEKNNEDHPELFDPFQGKKKYIFPVFFFLSKILPVC